MSTLFIGKKINQEGILLEEIRYFVFQLLASIYCLEPQCVIGLSSILFLTALGGEEPKFSPSHTMLRVDYHKTQKERD